jgi:16S rRNA (cytidine1402-2'-O)-methyltransferase
MEYFGTNRKASVSRELTKKFEETVNGSLQEIQAHFSSKEVKGEIVIVVAGEDERNYGDEPKEADGEE